MILTRRGSYSAKLCLSFRYMKNTPHALILFLVLPPMVSADMFELNSKNTLTVVEIDSGDTIEYRLRSGRIVNIELIDSKSEIVLTTLDQLKKGSPEQRTIYMMTCDLRIDGQEMRMVRYNPVQEAFYEPYTVNGLNVWFDGLKSLSEFFRENHGRCLPEKEARFALQDADLPICPDEIGNWFPVQGKSLDVHLSYGGEDTWMGPYFGADLHGGLDLNVPSNTTLYAPINFDEQFYFNSLSKGDNNNRWRGIRTWENGDVWHLQTHHLVEALVPENVPLNKGKAYAHAGGVRAGYTAHVHYVFKVRQPDFDEYLIDPWIIFWQSFKNNEEKARSIKAVMAPMAPANTGERMAFSSEGSRPGLWGGELEYLWDFGDGTVSTSPNPYHVFTEPGTYPVSLMVTDRSESRSYVQHITVNGPSKRDHAMWISGDGPYQFRKSVNWKTRAYGKMATTEHVVVFNGFRKQTAEFSPQKIEVVLGREVQGEASDFTVDTEYRHGEGWLDLATAEKTGGIELRIQPRIEDLIFEHGFYEANIRIQYPGVINGPIEIKVLVDFRFSNPASDVIVSSSGPDCKMSQFFWLAPEFHLPWVGGYSGDFLINKDNALGEYVRFRPNLKEGRYRVALYGPPYLQKVLVDKTRGFYVRVKHRDGIDKVWVEPGRSLEIGEFEFSLGRQGYVEVISDHSEGLIIVDAIRFNAISDGV